LKYLSNVFISGYRAYLNRNNDPKFAAIILILVCIGGYFGLTLGISKKIWGRDKVINFLPGTYVIILISGLIIFLLYLYFSDKRISDLLERFEQKPLWERRLWGWVTVFSILVPYTTTAILLTNF